MSTYYGPGIKLRALCLLFILLKPDETGSIVVNFTLQVRKLKAYKH